MRTARAVLRAPSPFICPKAPSRVTAGLTRDEVAALLRAALREPRVRLYLPLFVLIAVYTGARKEAILSLR
jgi:integrase